MTGRYVFGAVAALLLVCSSGQAQGPVGQGYPGSWQWYQPSAGAWQSPDAASMYSSYGPGGLTPVTPRYEPGPANHSWENITADRGGFYEDSPVDEFFKDLATGSYFRLEYLNWNFRDPGNVALGSGVSAVIDPTRPFDITVGGQLVGRGRLATTDYVDLSKANGIRATLGVQLRGGTLEGNIFSFQGQTQNQLIGGHPLDRLGQDPSQDPTIPDQYIATSTLTNGLLVDTANGQTATNLFLYDKEFRSRFSSDLWGTEINWLFDPYLPDEGFSFRPSTGFRYVDFQEQLLQVGTFDQLGFLQPTPLVSVITSNTQNRLYAPQIGFRAELSNRWVTLGVEPKIGAGVNVFRNNVITERLRSQGDPTVNTTKNGERFAITGDLSVYGRIHINQRFVLTVGYEFMFLEGVSRPQNTIYYNDNGASQNAGIVAKKSFDLMYFQGINVGGELRF